MQNEEIMIMRQFTVPGKESKGNATADDLLDEGEPALDSPVSDESKSHRSNSGNTGLGVAAQLPDVPTGAPKAQRDHDRDPEDNVTASATAAAVGRDVERRATSAGDGDGGLPVSSSNTYPEPEARSHAPSAGSPRDPTRHDRAHSSSNNRIQRLPQVRSRRSSISRGPSVSHSMKGFSSADLAREEKHASPRAAASSSTALVGTPHNSLYDSQAANGSSSGVSDQSFVELPAQAPRRCLPRGGRDALLRAFGVEVFDDSDQEEANTSGLVSSEALDRLRSMQHARMSIEKAAAGAATSSLTSAANKRSAAASEAAGQASAPGRPRRQRPRGGGSPLEVDTTAMLESLFGDGKKQSEKVKADADFDDLESRFLNIVAKQNSLPHVDRRASLEAATGGDGCSKPQPPHGKPIHNLSTAAGVAAPAAPASLLVHRVPGANTKPPAATEVRSCLTHDQHVSENCDPNESNKSLRQTTFGKDCSAGVQADDAGSSETVDHHKAAGYDDGAESSAVLFSGDGQHHFTDDEHFESALSRETIESEGGNSEVDDSDDATEELGTDDAGADQLRAIPPIRMSDIVVSDEELMARFKSLGGDEGALCGTGTTVANPKEVGGDESALCSTIVANPREVDDGNGASRKMEVGHGGASNEDGHDGRY